MKTNLKIRALSLTLAILLLFAMLPLSALAENAGEGQNVIDVVEGDAIRGFLPSATPCRSSDPAVAWVDGDGTLNALKPGTVTLSVYEGEDYTVNVADYSDGSPVVGNLKLLARYNDSMQFYDGHVYLLFTSYQDGVEVYVDDLYGYYQLSDKYYEDIREDIANGSNHTGTDTTDYFAFTTLNEPLVLDRGGFVTMGMYRGFSLSVPQAALGAITHSTYWADIVKAGKASVIENIFSLLESGKINSEEALARVKEALAEIGIDYTVALDGVVEGGVCFNRELYNQKLEWDQYENVTYEMDITQDQLNTLLENLSGNLDRFSIFKNSCATVALRAWNAAVGTSDGEPNAYYLQTTGSGIFSIVDAPKTVRDSIEDRLPGYYLNNSEGVEEPDAGYQDETGWVYVSAPEKVDPAVITYHNDTFTIDEGYTTVPEIIKAIDAEGFSYGKEAPVIDVTVRGDFGKTSGSIESVDFTCGGRTVTLDGEDEPGCYISFMMPYEEPAEGEYYTVLDNEGNELGADYYDGVLSIICEKLPITYNIGTAPIPEEQPQLFTYIHGDYEADVETEFYRYVDGGKDIIDGIADVAPGEKIYIRAVVGEEEKVKTLEDITVNGASILDAAHYDAEEGAYFFIVPEDEIQIDVIVRYGEVEITAKGSVMIQAVVGDVLKLGDYVTYETDGINEDPALKMEWRAVGEDNIFAIDGDTVTVTGAGSAGLWACSKSNDSIGVAFAVDAYESRENMAAITASKEFLSNMQIQICDAQGNPAGVVRGSGYLVDKGSVITLTPVQETAVLPYHVTANGAELKAGETYTVTGDTELKAEFYEAQVKNMPKSIKLAAQGDTYQLNAKVSYTGLVNQLKSVYDGSIEYVSSDSLVAVDASGLVTVAGEIPAEGTAVIVTAYAGSGNRKIFAQTKVVVGDYQGDKIVGRLTIHARSISSEQSTPHGCLTFTTYEDADLDVSYYTYYEPNAKYKALMQDYQAHPEKYSSDPALYSDNELGLSDRESYFDIHTNGAQSDPATVSLQAGESISISNYSFDSNNLVTVYKALDGTAAMTSTQVAQLVEQMKSYGEGEAIDGAAAFDNFVASLVYLIRFYTLTGMNPADGHSDGGVMLNREMFNQFRRNDTQLPNNYYTIEITADELAHMKAFLADPENNYYSLFTKNCATGAADVWNAALFDKPELNLTASVIGIASDPLSLHYQISRLRLSGSAEEGEFGKNFYPRTVAYQQGADDDDADDDAQGADGILGDADGDGKVTILDATNIQRILAALSTAFHNHFAADADGDGKVTIIDATAIQRFLASLPCPVHIGKPIADDPEEPAAPTEPADPQNPGDNALALAALADAFALDDEGQSFSNPDHIIYELTVDGETYRVIAECSETLYDAILELEVSDTYKQDMYNLIKDAKVTSVELIPHPAQAEIDALIGKTGQQLLDMGLTVVGYGCGGDDDSAVYTFDYGNFEYDLTFSGKVADPETFDWDEGFKTMTVVSVEYIGISGAFFDI